MADTAHNTPRRDFLKGMMVTGALLPLAGAAVAAPVFSDTRGRWEAACAAFDKADKAMRAWASMKVYDAHFDALVDVQYAALVSMVECPAPDVKAVLHKLTVMQREEIFADTGNADFVDSIIADLRRIGGVA